MPWSDTARPTKSAMRSRARAAREAADSGTGMAGRWNPARHADQYLPAAVVNRFQQIERLAAEIERMLE